MERARVELDAASGAHWVATRLGTAAESLSLEEGGRVERLRLRVPGIRSRWPTTEPSPSTDENGGIEPPRRSVRAGSSCVGRHGPRSRRRAAESNHTRLRAVPLPTGADHHDRIALRPRRPIRARASEERTPPTLRVPRRIPPIREGFRARATEALRAATRGPPARGAATCPLHRTCASPYGCCTCGTP